MSNLPLTRKQKAGWIEIVLSLPLDEKHREKLLSAIANPGSPNLMTTVSVFGNAAQACPSAAQVLKAISAETGSPLTQETERELREQINKFPFSDIARAKQIEFLPCHTEESAKAQLASFELYLTNVRLSRECRQRIMQRSSAPVPELIA